MKNELDPIKIKGLLNVISKKIGVPPEKLRSELEELPAAGMDLRGLCDDPVPFVLRGQRNTRAETVYALPSADHDPGPGIPGSLCRAGLYSRHPRPPVPGITPTDR